jgi:hypothetical protein
MYGVRMEPIVVRLSLANVDTVFACSKNDTIRDSFERAIHDQLLRLWGAVVERINRKPSIQLSLVQPQVSSSANSAFAVLAAARRGAKTTPAPL